MTNPFEELKNDPKKLLILIGLVTALILFVYFNFLLKPQVAGIIDNVIKVSKVKADLNKAESDISKIDQIKASIASYDEKIGSYGDLLPTEEGIPTLLESLSDMARSSNMKIVSIVPVESESGKGQKGQAYKAIPIMISARAGYHELGKFMSTLENSGRFMKCADMRMKANTSNPKKHDVELLVLTYVCLGCK